MSKIVHFRDTNDYIKHIDAYAEVHNCRRSDVIRKALKDFLVNEYGREIKHYLEDKK